MTSGILAASASRLFVIQHVYIAVEILLLLLCFGCLFVCWVSLGMRLKRNRSPLEFLTNLLSNTPISGKNSNYVRVRASVSLWLCLFVFSSFCPLLRRFLGPLSLFVGHFYTSLNFFFWYLDLQFYFFRSYLCLISVSLRFWFFPEYFKSLPAILIKMDFNFFEFITERYKSKHKRCQGKEQITKFFFGIRLLSYKYVIYELWRSKWSHIIGIFSEMFIFSTKAFALKKKPPGILKDRLLY